MMIREDKKRKIECLEKGCSEEAKIKGRCKKHRDQYYARMIRSEKENNKEKWE